MVALERGGRRQDHVGVPGRLVDVDVDGRHEVQAAERPVEPRPVGRREDGVAGERQQGPDLPVARRLDLLAQRRDRQLAGELRQAADAAAPHVVVPATDQAGAHGVDGRAW